MAQLGKLTVDLEANVARFNADMGRAAQQTETAMQKMRGAATVARGAILSLGGAAVVGGMGLIIKNAIDAADNLRDMSMQTGIAVETLNGLGFAAGQAGGSLESMAAAAGKLNRSIADAAGGKVVSAAFKALGISVSDASGELKKADVVMAEVADKFAGFADGPEKTALAMELFGKAGAAMIPLLNEGGAAMLENVAYAKQYSGATEELSAMADDFNDKLGKLAVQQASFGNAMAEAVLPVLNLLAQEMLGASEQSNKFALATDVVRTVLETFVVVGSEVAFTFKAVGNEIGGISAQLAALAVMDFKGFTAISDAMKADAKRARAEHDAFIKAVLDRTPRVVIPTGETDKPAAPRIPGTTRPAANGATSKAAAQGKTAAQMALEADIKAWSEEEKRVADAYRAENERALEAENRAIAQNERDVENIRQSLLTQAQAEDEAHAARMEALTAHQDAKLLSVEENNALIEAEVARHAQAKADLQANYELQSLAMAGGMADDMYSLLKQAGQEQTAIGKAVFLASKAIAVAEIIMQTNVAAAKAEGQLGIFGLPLSGIILATGYARAGMVAGLAIADASAEGGYDIPAGVNPMTQLHEREMVLPQKHADVIRDFADNGGSGRGMKLTIVNNTSVPIGRVTEQQIGPNERALIIEEAAVKGAQLTAAQMGDPNSNTSRALVRNFNIPRSR